MGQVFVDQDLWTWICSWHRTPFAFRRDLLFGVAGSAFSWRLYPWQLSQIEAYYGVQQAEMLSEAQMIAAMQALNIQQQQLNAEEAGSNARIRHG